MSFEMKYNKNGEPITPKEEPTFPDKPAETVETEVDLEAQEVESVEVEEVKPEPVKPTAPQESWKILREKAEKAERERDEAVRYAKEVEARTKNYTEEPEEDYGVSVEEDALVEGKHLSKVNKDLKKMQQQLKQYEQQATMNMIKSQLREEFKDWDKVFNNENLAKLQEIEPEIAHSLNSSTDSYKAGKAAYKMIKNLGIYNQDTFQAEKAVAQKNAAKPRPLASVSPQQGDSPLSHANAFANGLTDDLKSQLRKEMEVARRGY